MDRHHKAHLYDISTAIDEVYSFFEQVPKRFDEYQNSYLSVFRFFRPTEKCS